MTEINQIRSHQRERTVQANEPLNLPALRQSPFRPECAGVENQKSQFYKNFIALSHRHLSISAPSPFRHFDQNAQVRAYIQRGHFPPSASFGHGTGTLKSE